MKKGVFSRFLILLCATTCHISVAVSAPDLDLETLIAGIKHFDAAVLSGKGEIVYDRQRGPYEEKMTYVLTFDGTTFNDAQVRVDFSEVKPFMPIFTEICDGERYWQVIERNKALFDVEISPADSQLLNKAKPELPHAVKQKFKEVGVNVSGDFRIETQEGRRYSKWIDNVTGAVYLLRATEDYVLVDTPSIGYTVDPECGIDALLDPRYWMTYGLATPTSYLMTPLWHVLENYESEILRTEMLNGDETYLVNVKVSRGGLLKFWICPEKGFRLVKSQRRYECLKDNATIPMKKGTHYLLERILLYREYQPRIWYPEKIIETFHALVAKDPENKADIIGNTTLQLSSAFQLNLDVSTAFQLDVPPETLIYDGALKKRRPFHELTETSQ